MLGSLGSKVVVGIAYERGDMTGKEQRYTYNYVVGGPYTGKSALIDALRDYKADFSNYGFYGQADVYLSKQLLAVLGARYDTVIYDYMKLGSYGVASGSTSYSGFSPKVGLVYSPGQDTNFYANISTGFSPPEISTKYGGSTQGNTAETTTLLKEVGLRQKLGTSPWFLDLAAYQLDMKNATYSSSMSATYNADSEHKGLEIGLSGEVNKNLSTGLSLAVTNQEYTSGPRNNSSVSTSNAGKKVRYAPEQVASLFANYRFGGGAQIVIESNYVGSYWMDEENTREYGGHVLWHARLTRSFGPWEYWLSLRNIADRKYSEFSNYSFFANYYNPGAPRTVLAGVRYNFGGKAK
jgi:outer membrane receptor protein involved in Fe transport